MIERNIIGLVLTGQLDPSLTGLTEEHFSNFANKKLWTTICAINAKKQTPDVITLSEQMARNDPSEDWFTMLAVMAKDNIGSFSANGHIKQLKESLKVRTLRDIGSEILNSDNNDVNHYIKLLMGINSTEKKYLHTFAEAADDALLELERTIAGEVQGVTTGFKSLDEITGGFHNSDLIIVAARSAMGKTAFLLNTAAANKNKPLIFSTEQSRIQAAQRMFSIYGNVPNHKIRSGDLGDTKYESDEAWSQMVTAVGQINEADGFIYDKSGPYMSEIEATAREVHHNHGCSAIYLDYLQRIKHENPSLPNHEKVGDIAMRLKELARELNIPVVALAQVSRNVESRPDKRPNMSDIKDSGTIEQEADQIITIYRDEVYNEGSPDTGTAELTFKKNRHGGTGMVRVNWIANTMRFTDINQQY